MDGGRNWLPFRSLSNSTVMSQQRAQGWDISWIGCQNITGHIHILWDELQPIWGEPALADVGFEPQPLWHEATVSPAHPLNKNM